MRRRQHSRSGLFLIELTITIAFFAVTAAVFLQAFAKSHTISRQAEELFHAQSMASSVAEVLRGIPASGSGEHTQKTVSFSAALSTYFPEAEQAEGRDGARIYCDDDWQVCAPEDGVYVTSVFWEPDGDLWDVNITVGEVRYGTDPDEKDSGDKEPEEAEKIGTAQEEGGEADYIYQLPLRLYCPQTGGEAS